MRTRERGLGGVLGTWYTRDAGTLLRRDLQKDYRSRYIGEVLRVEASLLQGFENGFGHRVVVVILEQQSTAAVDDHIATIDGDLDLRD